MAHSIPFKRKIVYSFHATLLEVSESNLCSCRQFLSICIDVTWFWYCWQAFFLMTFKNWFSSYLLKISMKIQLQILFRSCMGHFLTWLMCYFMIWLYFYFTNLKINYYHELIIFFAARSFLLLTQFFWWLILLIVTNSFRRSRIIHILVSKFLFFFIFFRCIT